MLHLASLVSRIGLVSRIRFQFRGLASLEIFPVNWFLQLSIFKKYVFKNKVLNIFYKSWKLTNWGMVTCKRHEAHAKMKLHARSTWGVVRWNKPNVSIIHAGMKFQTKVALELYSKASPFIKFFCFFRQVDRFY